MNRPRQLNEKKKLQIKLYQLEVEHNQQRKQLLAIKEEANTALTSAQEAVERIETVVAAEEVTNPTEVDWFNTNLASIIAAVNAAITRTS